MIKFYKVLLAIDKLCYSCNENKKGQMPSYCYHFNSDCVITITSHSVMCNKHSGDEKYIEFTEVEDGNN